MYMRMHFINLRAASLNSHNKDWRQSPHAQGAMASQTYYSSLNLTGSDSMKSNGANAQSKAKFPPPTHHSTSHTRTHKSHTETAPITLKEETPITCNWCTSTIAHVQNIFSDLFICCCV